MAAMIRKVRYTELMEGMLIGEVTELSMDYTMLTPETLDFVRQYFAGAKARVLEEAGEKILPVGQLKPFDQLQGIAEIPSQSAIAKVSAKSGEFLGRHGLLEFMVRIPKEHLEGMPSGERLKIGSAEARRLHQMRLDEARKLLSVMQKAPEQRARASSAVEELLEMGRQGKISARGVEEVVAEIINTGSTRALKALAGLKSSDQTYAHCTDMAVILQDVYSEILSLSGRGAAAANKRFALVAGFMHDIGKSEVPREVLESRERFDPDSKEMYLLRNHVTYGAKILQDLGMPAQIINVAHYHHVKIDQGLLNSYPQVKYDNVLPMTRLAAIADVYQALIGRRSYKRNWVPGKAVEYLMGLAGTEFDKKTLEMFIKVMGKYPVGSLVRLNTGDLGFVMALGPAEFPERPLVAVVENASGEILSSHTLVDLMLDPEVGVEEVVDHYDHYNQSEDQAFNLFMSVNAI